MEVVLLGSGSGDGWPNPFCRCASCQAQRTGGVRRVSTSALVDATLLLDMGPDTARQAERLGLDLSGVRCALVTHAHPDHLAPALLLWRQWGLGAGAEPLTVLGPGTVTDEVQRWFADEPSIRVRTLSAGEDVEVAGYRIAALDAAHEVETLLYDVTGPDSARLLYATDTGPVPEATAAAVAQRRYDVVLLEETFGSRLDHATLHLDLQTFPRTLAALRGVGAVTPQTRIVAVHLGHHNPPEVELSATLAQWGVEPGRDGQHVEARRGPGPAGSTPHRTLLLGGARSGKSAAAESLLADVPEVVYVATSGERADDPEWRARVAAHQARRPPGWSTVATTGTSGLLDLLGRAGPPLLIDCLTLWLTAVMDGVGAWDDRVWRADGQERLTAQVDALVSAWRAAPRRVVAVSNEVGSGVVPDTWSGRVFRDELGRLNARVAAESDRVSLVVAGLQTRLR